MNTGKILVVEDERAINDALSFTLKNRGFNNIVSCRNGNEAIREITLDAKNIDIVLLDIIMPIMTGDKVLDYMDSLAEKPPVMILSNSNFVETEREYVVNSYNKSEAKLSDIVDEIKTLIIKNHGEEKPE